MAAPVDDSKIVVPFLPSLFHMALVKVALSLYYRFHYETLVKALKDIPRENSLVSEEGSDFGMQTSDMVNALNHGTFIRYGRSTTLNKRSEENSEKIANIAKENLFSIPGLLRRKVLDAVRDLHCVVFRWRSEYLRVLKLRDEDCIFYWRSDGTIDSTKTAQKLVLNGNIDTRKRFQVACMFCFEESIQSLWGEIEASGNLESFAMADDPMVRFWIRWMHDGRQVSWTKALSEYFHPPVHESDRTPIPRFSSFLPLLQPEDRMRFLNRLNLAKMDDLRFCLYSATKEEEDLILLITVRKLFKLYFEWPLHSCFLEMAEKTWKYLNEYTYCLVISSMWKVKEMKGSDYYSLFKDFWNMSPDNFKEYAKKFPPLKKINLHLLES